jgi:hypothetical protein
MTRKILRAVKYSHPSMKSYTCYLKKNYNTYCELILRYVGLLEARGEERDEISDIELI